MQFELDEIKTASTSIASSSTATDDVDTRINDLETRLKEQQQSVKNARQLLENVDDPQWLTEAILRLPYGKKGDLGVVIKQDPRKSQDKSGEHSDTSAAFGIIRSKRFASALENKFGVVVLDEAQCVKNAASRQHLSVAMLRAEFHILLSATLLMNKISDLFAYLSLARPLTVDEKRHCWRTNVIKDANSLGDLVKEYRLIDASVNAGRESAAMLLDLDAFSMLVDRHKIDFTVACTVLPLIWKAFRIRRLMGQSYATGEDQSVIIGDDLPPMMACEIRIPQLPPWQQWRFTEACQKWVPQLKAAKTGKKQTDLDPTDYSEGGLNYDAVRRLYHSSFMPILDHLSTIRGEKDKVEHLERWLASPRHGLDVLLQSMADECPARPLFRNDPIQLIDTLAQHSVKLQVLATIIKYHCIDRKERLVVFTEWLVPCWVTELFLMLFGIEIAVIRSSTKNTLRGTLCDEFTDPNGKIQVCILIISPSTSPPAGGLDRCWSPLLNWPSTSPPAGGLDRCWGPLLNRPSTSPPAGGLDRCRGPLSDCSTR